ncbi:MAG: FAD-dependent oxidoreductase [Bauldia sp.]|nr:FAD-dependent oxidoreductase [Bauldia sp.]
MVIVGAGHAGGRAAQALRESGWTGPLTVIGSESHPPHERPPLSKEMLAGTKTAEDCALLDRDFYREHDIDLRLDATAIAIDRGRREVRLGDESVIPYKRLLLATGAEPRRLPVPGATRDGVHTVRTIADSLALKGRLVGGAHLVIIGGGFIGLEVASNAVALGCKVTVIETGKRLLMRAVPPEISERMRARHAVAGVDIRLGRQVTGILGDSQVTAVRLDDGSEIACDAVLVSIGAVPRVALAEAAGLAVDNGILVDATLRTSDPDIFAAGDVCAFDHRLFGDRIRLESWKNAEEQGPIAAHNMLGAGEECDAAPWMWSDQYDMTIQIAGLPDRAVRAVERPLGDKAVVVFHLAADGRLVGASGYGTSGEIGRAIRLGQMMIERGLCPDPAALADPLVNLKALMRQQAA